MILILGFHDLLEGGEGILDHGRQHPARVGQPRAETTHAAHAGRTGRLADRAPLALRRLVGRRLVGGRVPHVAAVTPFGAARPLHLVGDLVRHAARAGLHHSALEVGDGVAALGLAAPAARLVTVACLAVGPRLATALRRATAFWLAFASGFRHLTPP